MFHSTQIGKQLNSSLCELRAKIQINAIFLKYFCSVTYNDLLKVEYKPASEAVVEDVINPRETCFWQTLPFIGKSYALLRTFAAFGDKL